MELLALLGIFAFLVVVAAVASGGLTTWWREEWKLLWCDTWAPPKAGITGGSIDEPRVAAMDQRMRAYAKRLRREGRHLIAGKSYVPHGYKPVEPARTTRKVVPIR